MKWDDLKVYKPLKKEELKSAKHEIENVIFENISKFGFKKYGRKLIRKSDDLFHIIHLDSRGSWMGASHSLKTEIAIVSIYDIDVFVKNYELTARKNIEQLNPKIRNYYQITQEYKLFASYISRLIIEIVLPYFDKYKSTNEVLKKSSDFKIDKMSEIVERNQNLILYSEISNHKNLKSGVILNEKIEFYTRLGFKDELINETQHIKYLVENKEWKKIDVILENYKEQNFKKLKLK